MEAIKTGLRGEACHPLDKGARIVEGYQEGFDDVTFDFQVAPVPEPNTIGLTLLGLGAMFALRRRRVC